MEHNAFCQYNSAPERIGENPMSDKLPAYEQIKRHVLARIHDGTWKEGDAIPSEVVNAMIAEHRKTLGITPRQIAYRIQTLNIEVKQF